MTSIKSFELHGIGKKVAATALLIAAPIIAVSFPAHAMADSGVLPATPPSSNAPQPPAPAPARAPLVFGGAQQPAVDSGGQADIGGGGGGGGG